MQTPLPFASYAPVMELTLFLLSITQIMLGANSRLEREGEGISIWDETKHI